jgi:hypothetical protein
MSKILHGKHKGATLEMVVARDPNYALYASRNYAWFPKLSYEQELSCVERYRYLPRHDWSTYDMADYGDGWC